MATVKQRELERDLRAKGFTTEILKTWQPKLDMWRHAPGLNENGNIVHPIGTKIPNQAKLWDHQLRMSTRGILPWKPGQECIELHKGGCTPCREQAAMTPAPAMEVAEALIDSVPFRSPQPEESVQPSVPEVPLLHSHQYKSRAMGAPCTHAACPAVRKEAYKKRKSRKTQAAVTMAEAAPNIGQSRGEQQNP